MTVNQWCHRIHDWAIGKGFWEGDKHISGNNLMLVVSEIGKAAEAIRNCDEANFREEIADTVIRLFDMCGGLGIDLEDETERKMAVNEKRPFRHGKKC